MEGTVGTIAPVEMQDTAKPEGPTKIWQMIRKQMRPLKRLYYRIRAKLSDLPWEHWEQYRAHVSFLSELYLRKDGRVNLNQLDLDIVPGCNLRCQHCTRLSPYRKGYVPVEKIVHWSETWSKKIRPNVVALLGGEPFLHPDLPTVVRESRRIWSDSRINVLSNGLLIPQASQEIFDVLKETKCHVHVSDHSGIDLQREKVLAGCERLKENGISYDLSSDNKSWLALHQYDAHGTPSPCQSIPRTAWLNCLGKYCPLLTNNLLYKCTILGSIIDGVNEGSLSGQLWKEALTLNALTPDADAATILKYFRIQEIQGCTICPDKRIQTEPRQMPPQKSAK